MTPSKIRLLAVLTGMALVASVLAAGLKADVSPGTAQAASAVAPPERRPSEPRSHIAIGPDAPPSAAAPVVYGEPAGAPVLRTGTGPAPRKNYLASAHPAQYYATRSATVRGGNAWAFVVGINDYAGSTRDNVGSYQDAVALRQYLLRVGWRSDHILLIGNREATRNHVIDGLRWLASKTDGSSMVVFHYSGHEKPYTRDVDGDGESRDVALWLADNSTLVDGDVGRLLSPIRASKMWINFAVCRAGGFNDAGTARAGRLITYSSPESELSYEDPAVRHSVFGYYSIVEGMQSGDADANRDGVTTVQEAFSYARPRVVERTGRRQHPVISDRYGTAFSLVTPVPPAPPPDPGPNPDPDPTPCALPIGCTRYQ